MSEAIKVQVLSRKDMTILMTYINEFIIFFKNDSIERIPSDFLNFLRKNEVKIEDGELLNELCDLIEEKLK